MSADTDTRVAAEDRGLLYGSSRDVFPTQASIVEGSGPVGTSSDGAVQDAGQVMDADISVDEETERADDKPPGEELLAVLREEVSQFTSAIVTAMANHTRGFKNVCILCLTGHEFHKAHRRRLLEHVLKSHIEDAMIH